MFEMTEIIFNYSFNNKQLQTFKEEITFILSINILQLTIRIFKGDKCFFKFNYT